MKTAISLPDPIFRQAERHARRTGKLRSQLYSEALSEYLSRHTPDAVTEAMDLLCDKLEANDAAFSRAAAQRLLRIEAW